MFFSQACHVGPRVCAYIHRVTSARNVLSFVSPFGQPQNLPQTTWLINNGNLVFTVVEAESQRLECQHGQVRVFFWAAQSLLCLHIVKGVQIFLSLFFKNRNLIMRAPPLWSNHLPKSPLSSTIILGIKFQHMNLGRGHIQTIAPSHLVFHGISCSHSWVAPLESIPEASAGFPKIESWTNWFRNFCRLCPLIHDDHLPSPTVRSGRFSSLIITRITMASLSSVAPRCGYISCLEGNKNISCGLTCKTLQKRENFFTFILISALPSSFYACHH